MKSGKKKTARLPTATALLDVRLLVRTASSQTPVEGAKSRSPGQSSRYFWGKSLQGPRRRRHGATQCWEVLDSRLFGEGKHSVQGVRGKLLVPTIQYLHFTLRQQSSISEQKCIATSLRLLYVSILRAASRPIDFCHLLPQVPQEAKIRSGHTAHAAHGPSAGILNGEQGHMNYNWAKLQEWSAHRYGLHHHNPMFPLNRLSASGQSDCFSSCQIVVLAFTSAVIGSLNA